MQLQHYYSEQHKSMAVPKPLGESTGDMSDVGSSSAATQYAFFARLTSPRGLSLYVLPEATSVRVSFSMSTSTSCPAHDASHVTRGVLLTFRIGLATTKLLGLA